MTPTTASTRKTFFLPATASDPHPIVSAVWQQDNGAIGARLITAYPG